MEVVRELAERARAAERALRQQRAEAIAKKRPAIRVRALVQPTFVRFVFEMPDGVGASSVLNDQTLTLQFSTLLTFDLADAKIAAPPNIASIDQKIEGDKTWVEIELIGDVDVHSFREDKNYIIDVAFQQADRAKSAAAEVAKVSREAGRASARSTCASAGRDHAADLGDDRPADEDGQEGGGGSADGPSVLGAGPAACQRRAGAACARSAEGDASSFGGSAQGRSQGRGAENRRAQSRHAQD